MTSPDPDRLRYAHIAGATAGHAPRRPPRTRLQRQLRRLTTAAKDLPISGCGARRRRCAVPPGGPESAQTGRVNVSFSVEGDYFEVCNCDVSCNCVWLGPAT